MLTEDERQYYAQRITELVEEKEGQVESIRVIPGKRGSVIATVRLVGGTMDRHASFARADLDEA